MSNLIKQCRDKAMLKAIAQKALELFLEECARQNLNVLIVETLRTKERQYYLACQGRTAAQAIAMGVPKSFAEQYANPSVKQVTWTLNSNHLDGMAFDFCKNIKGQEYADKTFFNKCGKIVAELGLEWGGSFGDSPHVQVPQNWKSLKEEYKVEKQKINLNGVVKEVAAVKIGDNNFIKLQDLRDDKIVIGYDEKNKLPVIKVLG